MNLEQILKPEEYRKLTTKEKKQYDKEYQILLDEYRRKVLHADCYAPHKSGYYLHIVTNLILSAPLSAR